MQADTISKPYTWAPLSVLPAAQLNSDFDTIYTAFNGNISDANVKSAAAIQLSKLALIAIAFNLQSTGNDTWAAGITGDTVPRISLHSEGGLLFGPGGGSAEDIGIFRLAGPILGVRNAANNADAAFSCGNFTFSGTIGSGSQAANTFVASPATTTGSVSLRTIVAQDIPGGGGIGGTGGDGATNVSSDPNLAFPQQYNATTFVTSLSGTLHYHSGSQIYATSTWSNPAGTTIAINPDIPGATANTLASGPGAPGTQVTASSGGNGGGCGGTGGVGGSATGNQSAGASIVGATVTTWIPLGATGSGGGMPNSATSNLAGTGGGFARFVSLGAMSNAGTITALGGAGTQGGTANQHGTGGGSAGVLAFYSSTSFTNAGGTVNLTGGTGGQAVTTGPGGGGGGAGIAFAMAPGFTAWNGAVTLTGGTAGAGSGSPTNGGTGVKIAVNGTPSSPLMAYHEKYMLWMAAFAQARNRQEICMTEHENLTEMAAFAAPTAKDFEVCMDTLTGGQSSVTITTGLDYLEDDNHV